MDEIVTFLRSKRGLISDLAHELNISKAAVSMWKRVPADKVVAVERFTGIPRHTLRPDVFPAPPESA